MGDYAGAEELVGDLAGEPIDRIPVAVVSLGRVDRSGDRPLGEMQPLHLQPTGERPVRDRTGEPEQHGDVGGRARRNRVLEPARRGQS